MNYVAPWMFFFSEPKNRTWTFWFLYTLLPSKYFQRESIFLIPAWDRWLLLTVKYLIFRFIPAVTTTANLVFILSLVQNDVQFLFISGKMNTGHRFSEESCTFFCLLISPVFLSKHCFIWAIYVFLVYQFQYSFHFKDHVVKNSHNLIQTKFNYFLLTLLENFYLTSSLHLYCVTGVIRKETRFFQV